MGFLNSRYDWYNMFSLFKFLRERPFKKLKQTLDIFSCRNMSKVSKLSRKYQFYHESRKIDLLRQEMCFCHNQSHENGCRQLTSLTIFGGWQFWWCGSVLLRHRSEVAICLRKKRVRTTTGTTWVAAGVAMREAMVAEAIGAGVEEEWRLGGAEGEGLAGVVDSIGLSKIGTAGGMLSIGKMMVSPSFWWDIPTWNMTLEKSFKIGCAGNLLTWFLVRAHLYVVVVQNAVVISVVTT